MDLGDKLLYLAWIVFGIEKFDILFVLSFGEVNHLRDMFETIKLTLFYEWYCV